MIAIQYAFIGSSFALAALYLVFPALLSLNIQLMILGILIVFLGLPHGALDPWIAKKIGLVSKINSSWKFNFGYFCAALAVVVLWSFFPVFSLLMFLIISSWHFSGDWAKQMPLFQRIGMGALVLLLPIGWHPNEVVVLFEYLSGPDGAELAHQLAVPAGLLASCSVGLSFFALLRKNWMTAFECIAFLALAITTPPLVYFVIYFCLRHSPQHLFELLTLASPQEQKRLRWTIPGYTLLTLIPVGLLGLWWSSLPSEALLMRVIFIGLAALTVPHMALIEWFKYCTTNPSTINIPR